MAEGTSYWQRSGAGQWTPTEHVGGAWDVSEQHVAPSLGLLLHAVETDQAARGGVLTPSRLSFDILGTMSMDAVDVAVEVLRPGRTISLVQATASQGGRAAVVLRAWLAASYDTAGLAGSGFAPMPPVGDLEPWQGSALWRGGFIAAAELRRRELAPGRAQTWVRTPHRLVDDEPVSRLAAIVGMIDIANGVAVRLDPEQVAFPNLDLTAHLLRSPAALAAGEPGWFGLDTTVSVGATGLGITHSVLHDAAGPLGTVAQSLTVRPG